MDYKYLIENKVTKKWLLFYSVEIEQKCCPTCGRGYGDEPILPFEMKVMEISDITEIIEANKKFRTIYATKKHAEHILNCLINYKLDKNNYEVTEHEFINQDTFLGQKVKAITEDEFTKIKGKDWENTSPFDEEFTTSKTDI